MSRILTAFAAAAALFAGNAAQAAELHVEAIMQPQQQMQLDFKDGSKHFFLMVHREGHAKGTGLLDGASVTEYGVHDIQPGVGGDPRGYLVFTLPNGGVAYAKWLVRGVFVPGPAGKPELLDNGFWEIVGATGTLTGLSGAGSLHIKPVSPTDRKYILDGELVARP
jgi:hypothetical protein